MNNDLQSFILYCIVQHTLLLNSTVLYLECTVRTSTFSILMTNATMLYGTVTNDLGRVIIIINNY